MIEILPNWHPIFVHFTVALLSMSVVFYVLHWLLPREHQQQYAVILLARFNLWAGTSFAVITAIAGWFAYNSVAHDTPSHAAMTEHRNWALVTLAVFLLLTFWSIASRKKKKAPVFFVITLLLAGGLLSSTAWHGAESVYRYGLGVMSMPQSSGEGHAHQHPKGEDHGDSSNVIPQQESSNSPSIPAKSTDSQADSQTPHDANPHQHSTTADQTKPMPIEGNNNSHSATTAPHAH